MNLISWNVNGIRAVAKKGFFDHLDTMNPDILCLQETKAQDDQVQEVVKDLTGYHLFSNSAERKGYSGTAILSKTEPISASSDIGIEEHDQEGRVLTLEYPEFYLVNVYVPNSGNGLARLDYRKGWDVAFLDHLKKLEGKKPVIACGDFNVAYQPIDIARPKSNYNKTAGYTQTEIDGFSNFLDKGFVDTFRTLHPEEVAYSWWSYRANAREKNIGWRIDYFITSTGFMEAVSEAAIHPNVTGSDHCPVQLKLSI
ncbi:MAG: exodeoxyribonuclease III [Bacteroidota bacterium]